MMKIQRSFHYDQRIAFSAKGKEKTQSKKNTKENKMKTTKKSDLNVLNFKESIYSGENDEEVVNCEGEPCSFTIKVAEKG